MKQIKSLDEINENEQLSVTIGNFDGVHVGHQHLISSLNYSHYKKVVITFFPHPAEVIQAEKGFLINSYKERRELLENEKIDYLVEIPFSRKFSNLSPKDFLLNHLFNHKNVKKIVIGYDFAFGADKEGSYDLIQKLALERKINVSQEVDIKRGNSPISSSLIREKIKSGEIDVANNCLGRNYFISGKIVKGDGRGKEIGCPTANITYSNEILLPKKGVYISKAKLQSGTYFSITNVGQNPTFLQNARSRIETHILDFSKDIYGEELEVSFIKYLREERKFEGVQALVSQIAKDIQTTREYFKL